MPMIDPDTFAMEATRWLGTPFREHTELCGVGADCVHLARGIYVGAGIDAPPIEQDDYTLDWAQHQDRSLVIEWIEGCGLFTRLLDAAAPLLAGDVVGFRLGRSVHHLGVMLDARFFIHTMVDRRAERAMIDDPAWARRRACVYRLRSENQEDGQ